ncbi:hypothetical protein BH09VER1_BH09VER1_07230 [soil metagenome]
MKSLISILACVVCGVGFIQAQQPVPGEAETAWPGVKFSIPEILRIDESHVLAVVLVKADASLANPVLIGRAPKAGMDIPANANPKDVMTGKYEPKTFSLAKATMIDAATEKHFAALPSLPFQPFKGPNAMLTTLGPGASLQMAVYFKAPAPFLPGPDGKRAEQKVSVLLPQATKPIEGLILPPEVAQPSSSPAKKP